MTLNKVCYFLLFCVSIPFLCSCTSERGVVAKAPVSIKKDSDYFPAFKRWKKDMAVYKDLELVFRGYVVLLSPQMQQACENRIQTVEGPTGHLDKHLVGTDQTISVLVSAFAISQAFRELDDGKTWAMALFVDGQWIASDSVYHYRTTGNLLSCFPQGSPWDEMYAVTFHTPQKSSPDASQKPVRFALKSGAAQTEFSWDIN